MSDEKGFGSKLLGIFVETGEGEKAKDDQAEAPEGEQTAAERVAELTAQVQSSVTATPTSAAHLDFESIFQDAGMDPHALDQVKKAESLLKGLPTETPFPVKKQIVETSLKTFGFSIEKIVQAAENQKRALDAYAKVNEAATAKAVQEAEQQIKTFNDKIAALRAQIEQRLGAQKTLIQAASARKNDVQKVVEFFQAADSNPEPKAK